MLQGKVHAALRVLEKSANLGLATMNDARMEEVRKLHPNAKEATVGTLTEAPYFDPVMFTNMSEKPL